MADSTSSSRKTILLTRSQSLWEQATAEWQRLVRDDPRDAEARFALGAALDGGGFPQEGLEHYRQAVALDPAVTAT